MTVYCKLLSNICGLVRIHRTNLYTYTHLFNVLLTLLKGATVIKGVCWNGGVSAGKYGKSYDIVICKLYAMLLYSTHNYTSMLKKNNTTPTEWLKSFPVTANINPVKP
jgi:hypothetical protein